jgi:glycosyltransferase involved in cell wall biosynthesis
MRKDHTAFMWKLKRSLYARSCFDVVVTSQWMQNLVAQSPMAELFKTHLIPFGIDLNVFRPMESARARARLGIAADSFVICFRSTIQLAKGLPLIMSALRRLEPSRPVCLLTFDKIGLLDEFTDRYRLVELGWVTEATSMVEAFSAADLFLMPSTAETFGMMAIEAMACGLPVVVCEGTALPEVVKAPHGGVTISRNDAAGLVAAIARLMTDEPERRHMGAHARAIVLRDYGLDCHVRKMTELYREVNSRWAADSACRS